MTDHAQPNTRGHLIHCALGYDLLVSLLTLGRERSFREKLLALAHLQPGESVLDIGFYPSTRHAMHPADRATPGQALL